MAGLKPFRVIPEDIVEWTRWMKAQDIPEASTTTVVTESVSSNAVTKFKTEDTVRTTDATLSNDPHLTEWQLESDTHYKITAYLKVNVASSTVPDIRIRMLTSNAYQEGFWHYIATDASTTVHDHIQLTDTSIIQMATGAVTGIVISGMIRSNVDSGGITDFQWSQNSSSGFATTIERGSWMTIEKLS